MSNSVTEKKLVSVLIPVFNVEGYVEEAVQSILNQTYKNLEIIMVDDASTDGTYEVVSKLALKDERIKLYRNSKNLNIAKSLNKAWSVASGEYIARMDGDDISAPDRIEKKVEFLKNNPEIDLVGCSLKTINTDGVLIGKSIYYADEIFLRKTLHLKTPVSHVWVARKIAYDMNDGYRNLIVAQDYDFLLRLTSLGLRYTNLQDYYGYYFRIGRTGNSIDGKGIVKRKVHNYVYQLFEEREKYQTDSFSSENLNKAIQDNWFSENLGSLSGRFLFRAVQAKGNQKKLLVKIFLFLSLISPYQIQQVYRNLKFRWLLKNHKNEN